MWYVVSQFLCHSSFDRFIWRHRNADSKGNWFPFVKTIFVKFSNSVFLTPEMNNPQLPTFTFPKVPCTYWYFWEQLGLLRVVSVRINESINLSFASWKSLIMMKWERFFFIFKRVVFATTNCTISSVFVILSRKTVGSLYCLFDFLVLMDGSRFRSLFLSRLHWCIWRRCWQLCGYTIFLLNLLRNHSKHVSIL